MAESPESGLQEERTRVTVFLPLNDAQEDKAVRSVIHYLEDQRRSAIPVTGFTRSLTGPHTVFTGYWWSKAKKGWDRERVVLFVIDYGLKADDRRLEQTLGRLVNAIKRSYERYGKRQEQVWLIAERIARYVASEVRESAGSDIPRLLGEEIHGE